MELKDIKLRKGMTRDKVNELTKEYTLLEDDVYMGNAYKHSWRCKCGDIIRNKRAWRDVKSCKLYLCEKCKYNEIEQRYKTEVEKTGEYEYIRSFRRGDILPNGKIVGDNPYIQVKHKYCGSIYEVISSGFISGRNRCSKCCRTYESSFAYHIEVELGESLEKYWDFEKNTVNPYHIYKNYIGKVWIKCQEKDYHGSYEISCNKFISRRRCPYCVSKKIHPLDSFGYHNFDKVMSWHTDNDISPFKVSRASNKKYKFKCETCSHEWSASIYSVNELHTWCPNCSLSKGEKSISEWLTMNKVNCLKQYRLNNCKFKKPLPFDFYLPDYNTCIEYDGRQHFEIVKDFGGLNGFIDVKIRDIIKNEYCKNNNIKLIRIPYWEFDNVEKILNENLKL